MSDGVVVSLGDGFSSEVAAKLASATGRPHLAAAADAASAITDLSPLPTAVVAELSDIDRVGTWPGFLGERVGVITGRTRAAINALVERTIVGPRPVLRQVLATSPASRRAHEADALNIEELAETIEEGPAQVVFLESHGRECCINLPGGLVCGRAIDTLSRAIRTRGSLRIPSCLQEDGCFQGTLRPQDMLPASRIDADLVVVSSCNAISVGVNSEPAGVSVTLSILEGNCRAVIGAVGNHTPHPNSYPTVQRLLRERRTLGHVLAELNALETSVAGPFGRLGLLGDPALVLEPTAPKTVAV